MGIVFHAFVPFETLWAWNTATVMIIKLVLEFVLKLEAKFVDNEAYLNILPSQFESRPPQSYQRNVDNTSGENPTEVTPQLKP